MPQFIRRLQLGVNDRTLEKWEKNISRPTEPFRSRLVKFLGFDPEASK